MDAGKRWIERNMLAAQAAAVFLVNIGVTRHRSSHNALMMVASSLVGLADALEEICRPGNRIVWVFMNCCQNDFDDLMAEINDGIERASAPMGFDRFVIVVERRASLPDDSPDISFERADATCEKRALVGPVRVLRGDRWCDWKRGNSKQELRAMLAEAIPVKEAPITIIRAAVLGHVAAVLAARFAEGG